MTRYHARWICPIASPPLRDATLVEEGGRITFVGPRHAAPPRSALDVDLGDVVLTPGLVNAHCHLELTAMRGFLDGLGFREWILRLTSARRAVLSREMLRDSARLGVEEGLRYGITTFADTGDSGAGFDAMLERGVRGICYREVFGPDPASSARSIAELVANVAAMRERASALVHVGVSPHAPYSVSDALFRETAAFARAYALPLATHIAESAEESDLVERAEGAFAVGLRARGIDVTRRGRSPIGLLDALGVLDLRPLLIHCVRVDAQDVETIARHDCAIAHCPASNARLAHGVAPLARFLDASIRTGLGSDSVASNDRMDILEEARLASLFATAREQTPAALPATRALQLATLGGAMALGLDDRIGSLEPGKSADLAAFALDPHRGPLHDPASALIFSLAGPAVFVAVAGNVLVRNGRLLNAEAGLPGRVQESADQLRDWLAGGAADVVTTSATTWTH